MIHIALLIPTIDQIGGAERQLLLLAPALATRGWRVTVIALSGTGQTAQENLAQSLSAGNVKFVSLHMRKAWIDPAGWFRYLAWHRRNNPAILHAHLPHATCFARMVRPLAPVRALIDTIHTSRTEGRRTGYRLTRRLTTHVTCVSQPVAEAALAARLIDPDNLTILSNGIPLPGLPVPRPATPTFHWIAIGRLVPLKDYPTLLRAFALLPGHTRLMIAGTGPEESALRDLAAELGIFSRIHFAGFQAEIQPLLTISDAFVLSSLWEGLPLSLLEAQAAALPVVATNGPGTRCALIPGQTGILAPVRDHETLASAMAHIMSLPAAERRSMGLRGRRFIEENYALPKIVAQWEALYLSLLAGHPNPTRMGN